MAIPNTIIAQLVQKGIYVLNKLKDFYKNFSKQITNNLRNSGRRIPYLNPNAPANSTIATPLFIFGAKSQKGMLEDCEIVKYYFSVTRLLASAMIKYKSAI